MKSMTYSKNIFLALPLALALWSGPSTLVSAQTAPADNNPPPSWCPDYMGGHGMAPGMMDGHHGMMGDYDAMGPGMMGYGTGYGMMSGFRALDLSDEQRAKIDRIGDETRRKNWELTGKIQQDSNALRDLYYADTPDPAAIGKAYQKIFDLRRQMIESSIDARNRMEAVLTKEQRDRFRQTRHRGWMMWPAP